MKKLTALFLASTAILSGCNFTQTIEPPSKDRVGIEGVRLRPCGDFNGAAKQGVACVVDGARLKADSSYTFNSDLLVIRGDVPNNVSIDANRAKVFINGNAGNDVRIAASKPENYRTDIILMPMPMSCGQNCTTMMLVPVPVTDSTGFTYPSDRDSSLVVTGHVGQMFSYSGNGTARIANGNAGDYSNMYALSAVQQALALH